MTTDRRLVGGVAIYVLLTVVGSSTAARLPSAASAKRAITRIADDAKPYLDRWGYAAVFGTVAAEALGIPAPGHTVLIAAALAAARGPLDIRWVISIAAAGTILGSQVAWAIGARVRALLQRRSSTVAVHLAKTERAFRQWGDAVVVFGPFVEGIRQLNALAAGALEMPWLRFTLCNAMGTVLWLGVWGIGTWLLVGDIAGAAALAHDARPWLLGLTAAAVAAGLVWGVARWRQPA